MLTGGRGEVAFVIYLPMTMGGCKSGEMGLLGEFNGTLIAEKLGGHVSHIIGSPEKAI